MSLIAIHLANLTGSGSTWEDSILYYAWSMGVGCGKVLVIQPEHPTTTGTEAYHNVCPYSSATISFVSLLVLFVDYPHLLSIAVRLALTS